MVLENREGPGEPRAVDGRGPDELEGQADLLFCGSTQATPLQGQGDAEQVRLGLVGDQRRRHLAEFHKSTSPGINSSSVRYRMRSRWALKSRSGMSVLVVRSSG